MSGIGSLVAAFAALAVAVGGYVQFVLRRSIFPCIEFDVDLVTLGHSGSDRELVEEVVLSIDNVGPGVGFVANVQCRVRYSQLGESGLGPDGVEPNFAHSLTPDLGQARSPGHAQDQQALSESVRILGGEAFALASGAPRNFIQPGVTQRYRKPLAFPQDTRLIHVWGAFEYHIEVGRITWALARVLSQRPDRRSVTYTVRRTFRVADRQAMGGNDRAGQLSAGDGTVTPAE